MGRTPTRGPRPSPRTWDSPTLMPSPRPSMTLPLGAGCPAKIARPVVAPTRKPLPTPVLVVECVEDPMPRLLRPRTPLPVVMEAAMLMLLPMLRLLLVVWEEGEDLPALTRRPPPALTCRRARRTTSS